MNDFIALFGFVFLAFLSLIDCVYLIYVRISREWRLVSIDGDSLKTASDPQDVGYNSITVLGEQRIILRGISDMSPLKRPAAMGVCPEHVWLHGRYALSSIEVLWAAFFRLVVFLAVIAAAAYVVDGRSLIGAVLVAFPTAVFLWGVLAATVHFRVQDRFR